MDRDFLVAGLVALLASAPAASAQSAHGDSLRLNLKQCVEMAMSRNLDLQETLLERDRAVIDKF